MPTPSVSVPQMTRSSPAWASVSTSRRYFGSMPAWCTPMPLRTIRDSVLPKPAPNRKPPMRSAIASLSTFRPPPLAASRDLSRLVACSTAAAWVKWTT